MYLLSWCSWILFASSLSSFCILQSEFNKKNTYYIFNHVDIFITYHKGTSKDWEGARLVAAKLVPKR